jgi:hypothetical protein
MLRKSWVPANYVTCFILNVPRRRIGRRNGLKIKHGGTLSEPEQGKVDARVPLLMERGPNLERHLRTIKKERTEHG